MRKIFLVIISITFLSGLLNAQNYNWITPNKQYLKMYVADDGMYRIVKSDFVSAGINTTGLDPRTVKVYNKGVQIPVYFQGEQDGIFDPADYIDFYGTRNYGGITKTYDENNNLAYTTNEYNSLYSDTNVYWADWGGANGLRMQESGYSTSSLYPQQYYYDLVHLEKDKIYWLGEYKDGNDFRDFTNERFLGETWYWAYLGSTQTVSDTFSTPLLYSVPQNASVRIFAYPQNISTSIFNEHTLQIKINNTTVATITVNDYKKIDTTITFSSSLLSGSTVNTATALYTANGGFEGYMFFDLFEIKYPKVFKFRNSQSLILLNGSDTTSAKFNLSSYNSSLPLNIYDVNNGIRINNFTNSADTLFFSGKRNSKFEILNKDITKKPFRIIQRQVPDYVSNSNGTDYLLLYNSLFETQATLLKNYRESHDNFRVTKAEINYVYDIFNYGIEDPVAVRNFTKYIYSNWQAPKIKYICLFGRGSLDPKKNSPTTVYEKNLIPVMGNPTSDNYFSNINEGGFTYYNQIAIGRLPAYTSAEAQSMFDNIVTYESQSPADWWKSFTLISGGTSSYEQSLFLPYNDSIVNQFVLPKPVSGNPVRIYRNDLNGAQTYNYSDSIKNQINRGSLTVNFMGHAGSQDWEIGMTDPNILTNYDGKFPLIFSMTCYTGKIADPNSRIFGERFMTMTNKGAIGYVGTSGWGFIYSQSLLNNWMYNAITKDTVRRLGDIFSIAINKIKSDSSNSSIRHTINCYTLQGDPAAKLILPKNPEYAIGSSDYKLSNPSPSINEPTILTIYPKNFGLYSDSCNIKLQIATYYKKYLTKDTVLKNFKFSDSLKYNIKLSEPASYYFTITLDYLGLNPNENRNNNILTFKVTTKDYGFVQLKPVNNAVIKKDSVEFVGLNPFINLKNSSVTVLLEFDTTKNFNSPLKQTFIKSNVTGVSTKFNASIPRLDSNILYYWRTNSIITKDTTGWSQYQTFRYNPVLDFARDNSISDSSAIIYKNRNPQFYEGDLSNTYFSTAGIKLNTFTGNLYVRSLGSNGAEASYFSVLNKSIHIDAGGNTGLNLLKVRKLDGVILQFKNFKMLYPNSSDSILNFLNTFDSTHYLMGLNSTYVGGTYLLNAATISKFNQFGSTKVNLFRIGFFDSWSFIGYLNAPPSEVSEDIHTYNNAWVQSVSSMDRSFQRNNGTVSYYIGPSDNWENFSWQRTLLGSNNIKFDVYGIDKNEAQALLLTNLTTNNFVDLSGINSYQYPKLNLVAKLSIDTVTGLQTPVLNSFKINYTPPSEIVPEISSFWQSDTVLNAGNELKLKFKYYNVGNVSVPGVIVNIYKSSVAALNLIKSDTITRLINIDSSYNYSNKFIVPYIRMDENNKAQFIVEVFPKGQNNEFYTFNNFNSVYLRINVSPVTDKVELFSDGQPVHNGDFVASKPEFKLKFNDLKNDVLLLSDTSQIILVLNDKHVPYHIKGEQNELLKISNNDNKDGGLIRQSSVVYFPILSEGKNKLKVIYKNSTDNMDSTEYDFLVSNELLVKDLYNYPNPMQGETNFIFNLLGSEIPFNCKIRIYSISGRLIKELNYSPVIGYNQIPWDGKDNDGDIIANGTYLYKFIAEDNSKKETAIQKLVILR